MSTRPSFEVIEKEIVKNTKDPVHCMDMLAQAFIVLNELPAKKIEEIGNLTAYVLACAARVIHKENQPVAWESLDETDDDGKPIHQVQSVENDDELAELEAQLPIDMQEFLDFVRREGTAGLAEKNKEGVRNAQRKFKEFTKQINNRNTVEQLDLFGLGV